MRLYKTCHPVFIQASPIFTWGKLLLDRALAQVTRRLFGAITKPHQLSCTWSFAATMPWQTVCCLRQCVLIMSRF